MPDLVGISSLVPLLFCGRRTVILLNLLDAVLLRSGRGSTASVVRPLKIPGHVLGQVPSSVEPPRAGKPAVRRCSEGYLCDARLSSRQAIEQSADGMVYSPLFNGLVVILYIGKACLVGDFICLIVQIGPLVVCRLAGLPIGWRASDSNFWMAPISITCNALKNHENPP